MIKLKLMVFLTSICMALPMISSEQKAEQTATPTQPTLQGSTILTTLRYGAGKWFAGETETSAFFRMYQDDTLKGDLNNNPAEALNRFSAAVRQRFTHKTKALTDRENQQKVYNLLQTAESLKKESRKDFQLPKMVAEEYNPLQEKALEEITSLHAMIAQPELEKQRDEAINRAHSIYQKEMGDLLQFAAQAAYNKRYLHAKAEHKTVYELQNENHYQNIESYTELLTSIQKNQSQKHRK